MDSDRLAHLLAEVIQGVDPKDSSLPDTHEVRDKRAQLAKEVAEIRKKGLTPDVGMEFPEASAQA